ncbi:DUF1963 domain-containing protein [Kitasatospora aureofaciens]|uniref:DUF1963 domain-containing protein n=1 Tax=Kitasatospora aureofaciens TaxID=1894 RepID=UPI001C455ACC|nr:DUF1963 domain-containing protein [Kitasatospora aureofaciens]MBV6699545.1 DUF1963 domain-containing protein [Kitasatospora aureofaciens]
MTEAAEPTPADLVAALPALARYLRPATLLHPEAGTPTAHGSSVGGPPLWPAGAPWPHCTAGHLDDAYEDVPLQDREIMETIDRAVRERAREHDGAHVLTEDEYAETRRIMNGADSLDHVNWRTHRTVPEPPAAAIALVPLARIRAADAPHLPWPDGTDLLQVLWCPNDHDDIQDERYYYGPAVELHWQRAAELGSVTPPQPRRSDEYYLPTACVLRPEQIQDLPDRDEIPDELHRAAEEFAERHGIEYHRGLACAEGWKLGGWPSWHSTDLIPIDCGACGTRMRHLLTVESGGDPDLSVGRHGELHVFLCPEDRSHPVGLDLQ